MKIIEFEIERTIPAPVDEVFARLVDLEGYNTWMPRKGSIRKHTRQTSPGEPTVGTTYVDETIQGDLPGELAVCEAPGTVGYHWWERSKSGRLKAEGWPGYALIPTEGDATLVRHHARMELHGSYRLLAPIFRRMALRERTVTIEALRSSFESSRLG